MGHPLPFARCCLLLCLAGLAGCAPTGNILETRGPVPLELAGASRPPVAAAAGPATKGGAAPGGADGSYEQFRAFGRRRAAEMWDSAAPPPAPAPASQQPFRDYARDQGESAEEEFFNGRYNRSRARLPGNIGKWESEPDIGNPGPDLANFPNSAFTLPQGHAYLEASPVAFYGSGLGNPAQYNAEFLLRYGLTDDIELRLFSNGPSWVGGSSPAWGFSPLAVDTKIFLWTEKPDYLIPATGFEAYLQTEWLGSPAFNSGLQPAFTFNFDQSLPWGIDFEYNLGATRFQDFAGQNVWEFSFQWALQRDFFHQGLALFVHGFYNATSLPRLPNVQLPCGTCKTATQDAVANLAYQAYKNPTQNAVGGGFVWTVSKRVAVYGQVSGGTTRYTPSVIGMLGFAVAF